MTPNLSIITPSYNYATFLEDALRSVAGQRFNGYEHIVVDDASTDGSQTVLHGWTDRVSLLVHDRNRGLSNTLNEGVRHSEGDWIGWLNADDFYLPGTFEHVRRVIEANPMADVIHGDTVYVDSESRLMRLAPQHRMSRSVLRRFGPFIAPPAFFVRRAVLPRRGFDPETRKLMDWDLYLQLLEDGATYVHTRRPLGAFRIHRLQASNTKASLEERRRVRGRYGLPYGWIRKPVGALGQVQHGVLKLANGGFVRERAAANFVGADLRWFADAPRATQVNEIVQRLSAAPHAI